MYEIALKLTRLVLLKFFKTIWLIQYRSGKTNYSFELILHKNSRIYLLVSRIDVRWGFRSTMIKRMKSAAKQPKPVTAEDMEQEHRFTFSCFASTRDYTVFKNGYHDFVDKAGNDCCDWRYSHEEGILALDASHHGSQHKEAERTWFKVK